MYYNLFVTCYNNEDSVVYTTCNYSCLAVDFQPLCTFVLSIRYPYHFIITVFSISTRCTYELINKFKINSIL